MTSFSFILGVAPLAVATGAGAEMRQSLGTAVLFGMLGVTGFGLLFTPAFYTFIRKLGRKDRAGPLSDRGAYSALRDIQAGVRST
jgi:Cu/Ag efflux pump CusA